MAQTEEEALTVERAMQARNYRSAINAYMTACEEFLLEQAEQGNVPGFRVVPKYGHAKWDMSDEEVEQTLRATGCRKKDVVKEVIISPAQARKLVGEDMVKEMSSRPEKGKKLAVDRESFDELFGDED